MVFLPENKCAFRTVDDYTGEQGRFCANPSIFDPVEVREMLANLVFLR